MHDSDSEHQALRDAWEHARDGDDAERHACTLTALTDYLQTHDRLNAALDVFREGLTVSGDRADVALEITCRYGLAAIGLAQNDFPSARAELTAGASLAAVSGDLAGQARMMALWGRVEMASGDLNRAAEVLATAKGLAEIGGLSDLLCRVQISEADIHILSGRQDVAAAHLKVALQSATDRGDTTALAALEAKLAEVDG